MQEKNCDKRGQERTSRSSSKRRSSKASFKRHTAMESLLRSAKIFKRSLRCALWLSSSIPFYSSSSLVALACSRSPFRLSTRLVRCYSSIVRISSASTIYRRQGHFRAWIWAHDLLSNTMTLLISSVISEVGAYTRWTLTGSWRSGTSSRMQASHRSASLSVQTRVVKTSSICTTVARTITRSLSSSASRKATSRFSSSILVASTAVSSSSTLSHSLCSRRSSWSSQTMRFHQKWKEAFKICAQSSKGSRESSEKTQWLSSRKSWTLIHKKFLSNLSSKNCTS